LLLAALRAAERLDRHHARPLRRADAQWRTSWSSSWRHPWEEGCWSSSWWHPWSSSWWHPDESDENEPSEYPDEGNMSEESEQHDCTEDSEESVGIEPGPLCLICDSRMPVRGHTLYDHSGKNNEDLFEHDHRSHRSHTYDDSEESVGIDTWAVIGNLKATIESLEGGVVWCIIDDLFGSDWIDSDGHDLYICYFARLIVYSTICETRQSALHNILSDSRPLLPQRKLELFMSFWINESMCRIWRSCPSPGSSAGSELWSSALSEESVTELFNRLTRPDGREEETTCIPIEMLDGGPPPWSSDCAPWTVIRGTVKNIFADRNCAPTRSRRKKAVSSTFRMQRERLSPSLSHS